MKSRPIYRPSVEGIFRHTIDSAEIEGIFLKDKDKKRILEALKETKSH
jgi:hypothetical protein